MSDTKTEPTIFSMGVAFYRAADRLRKIVDDLDGILPPDVGQGVQDLYDIQEKIRGAAFALTKRSEAALETCIDGMAEDDERTFVVSSIMERIRREEDEATP